MITTTVENPVTELAQDGVVAVQESGVTKLICVRGALWVTADHNRTNIILRDGEQHTLKPDELTLAIALEPSQYRLYSTGTAPARGLREWVQRSLAFFAGLNRSGQVAKSKT